MVLSTLYYVAVKSAQVYTQHDKTIIGNVTWLTIVTEEAPNASCCTAHLSVEPRAHIELVEGAGAGRKVQPGGVSKRIHIGTLCLHVSGAYGMGVVQQERNTLITHLENSVGVCTVNTGENRIQI